MMQNIKKCWKITKTKASNVNDVDNNDNDNDNVVNKADS